MKHWVFFAAAAILLVFFSRPNSPALKSPPQSFYLEKKTGELTEIFEETTSVIQTEVSGSDEGEADEESLWLAKRVIDGDTFEAVLSDITAVVRLIGVDAPELKKKECFGPEAREFLRQIIEGKRLKLEGDPTQDEFDRYGRRLAYAWLADRLVNAMLIEEGYAHEFSYIYPYLRQQEFRSLELAARLSKRGLWAEDACDRRR